MNSGFWHHCTTAAQTGQGGGSRNRMAVCGTFQRTTPRTGTNLCRTVGWQADKLGLDPSTHYIAM